MDIIMMLKIILIRKILKERNDSAVKIQKCWKRTKKKIVS